MKCTWNKLKNEINIKKHGISFELASKVFFDESRIEWYDEEHSIDEDRYITIGIVGEVIFVFTERKEKIRLISARLANKDEKEAYYENKKRKK